MLKNSIQFQFHINVDFYQIKLHQKLDSFLPSCISPSDLPPSLRPVWNINTSVAVMSDSADNTSFMMFLWLTPHISAERQLLLRYNQPREKGPLSAADHKLHVWVTLSGWALAFRFMVWFFFLRKATGTDRQPPWNAKTLRQMCCKPKSLFCVLNSLETWFHSTSTSASECN